MASSLANLKLWLLLAGAAGVVVSPACAQPVMKQGQSILFSSPVDDSIATNVPALSARPPVLSGFASAVQAPLLDVHASPQTAPLPMPSAPMLSTVEAAELKKQLDERKNWTMLTPEEILGLTTPEKILGLSGHDADRQPGNESVAERYLDRQARASNAATNGYAEDDSSAPPNFSGSQAPLFSPISFVPANNGPDKGTLMDQFLNGASANSTADTSQNQGFNWPKVFSSPAAPAAPTAEQQAADAAFQKLLEPHSPAPAPVKNSPGGMAGSIFSASQNPASPLLGQPALTPVGASFAPLGSGINLPAGVAPLPGLISQSARPATAPAAPEWKPQLPPWMSSEPQLGAVPQRKF